MIEYRLIMGFYGDKSTDKKHRMGSNKQVQL